MGVQIPYGIYAAAPTKDVVDGIEESSRVGSPQAGRAKGKANRRRPLADGSGAYADIDPAAVCGVASGRIHQGQECVPSGSGVRITKEAFRGAAFLGQRIFRFAGGYLPWRIALDACLRSVART